MESNKALTTICIILCLSASFFTCSVVDARRKQVGFEKDPKQKPKKLIIKASKHTSLLEKMMTRLNLAQPLDYSTTFSNTQPYGINTPLTLPPYVSLPPLSVPENAPSICANPPNTPLNSPPSSPYPGLSPPPGPITLPNPPESSSNPNPPESSSNPNSPESSSNPNSPESSSNPNPPESSSNPNPPESSSNPNPPESSSNPNPPESSSNPNPPVTVPYPPGSSSNPNPPVTVPYPPPESSSPNPSGTAPSPPKSGYTPGQPGSISGPPYYEPGPSTPIDTPTPSGGIPPSTGSIPSPSSGFLPPIVYPPPMVPPPPTVTPTSAYWCVAKPTVPDPIIQEAMNFACGSGADCHSIQPNGPCFKPNTLWAHASFAFNSYWQRTKGSGGSCTFGGTGMLVTVDPSFNGCHFDYF